MGEDRLERPQSNESQQAEWLLTWVCVFVCVWGDDMQQEVHLCNTLEWDGTAKPSDTAAPLST